MPQKALYLAGGGARGAYQTGVLKAIGHIVPVKRIPFDIICGVSVGSINAVVLAELADDFHSAIEKLESIWGEIHCQQIYKASNYELSKSVLRNLSTLVVKQSQSGHLLDTSPFFELIDSNIDFSKIRDNIDQGILTAFEVIAACYENHHTVSFYNHKDKQFPDWYSPRHSSQRTILKTEHIIASSALPLFFPPVAIDNLHYGDGSIGLISPLRGAIRFNVDKIMILGTRELPDFKPQKPVSEKSIPFAHVLGSMLGGLFLDSLDRDIEMVNKMNDIATLLSIWKKHRSPWRPIHTLHLRPSRSMSAVAQEYYTSMPALLRYLLNILGSKQKSGDLLSFLLFEKEYARALIDLGYRDTMAISERIETFFTE